MIFGVGRDSSYIHRRRHNGRGEFNLPLQKVSTGRSHDVYLRCEIDNGVMDGLKLGVKEVRASAQLVIPADQSNKLMT